MKIKKNILNITGFTALFLLIMVLPVFAGDRVTSYWGVFVGISNYETVPDLDFAADDAKSVYDLLLLDSNWSASRMTLLQNYNATRSAVKNAITAMASNSDDDDICLFFFSGHGGQADTDFLPFDETDDKDEYIACWDSNDFNYSGDYTDDDMGNTLGLISGTTIVMLDSCNSGGYFKGVSKKGFSEKIQTERKIKFVRKPFEQKTGVTKTGGGFASDLIDRTSIDRTGMLKDADDQSDIIILTASDDNEESEESLGLRHGVFTYFLLLGLKSNDQNDNGYVSAEESFAYVKPAVTEYSKSIFNPQLYDKAAGEINLVKPTTGRAVYIGHNDFSWDLPWNTYYQKRRVEYIYSQSQLGGEGLIMALKIFIEERPPISLQNCTIRMQHTTKNSYNSQPQWTSSNWTTVYSGTKTIDSEEPVSFMLSTPFQYNGTQNLIIDFSFSNSDYSNNEGLFFGSFADNTYPMIYYMTDDDTYGVPTNWIGISPQPIRDENDGLYGSYLDIEFQFTLDDIESLTQTQVSQLYVSIFGRASEGDGNAYWMTNQEDILQCADTMLATEPAKTYFGATLYDNQMFIEFIYENTLGKTYADDPAGVNYWVSELASGKSKGKVIATLINAAMDPQYAGLPAQNQFINKVTVSNYTADIIAAVPDVNDLSAFVEFISDVTDDPATVVLAKAAVDAFIINQ